MKRSKVSGLLEFMGQVGILMMLGVIAAAIARMAPETWGTAVNYIALILMVGIYFRWRAAKDPSTLPVILLASLAGILSVIWIGWIHLMVWISPEGGHENAGIFGDSFGGFTALLTALGFAGVSTTLYLQMRQMEEHRESRRNDEERHQSELTDERKTRAEIDAKQEEQLKVQQEQLALMRQQMDTMVSYFKGIEEDRKREREIYVRSLEPDFYFTIIDGHEYGPSIAKISNRGGGVYDLSLKEDALDEGFSSFLEIEGSSTVPRGDSFQLIKTHHDGHDEPVEFSFRYRRAADHVATTQRFVWSKQGIGPRSKVE